MKDKENVLASAKNNKYLPALLEANLNPYRLFQFNKMPGSYTGQVKEAGWGFKERYECFISLLKDLEARHVTGNKAKETVESVFKLFSEKEYNLYTSIILKAPIGVGAKTVNKVWPGLVPEFDLMLAPNELPIVTQLTWPRIVQPKLDDYRCIYRSQSLWSRAGKPFANENLEEYFDSLFNTDEYVLDGGLYAHGIPFNRLQRILNNETAPLPANLKFHVWDAIPKDDWDRQYCNTPYEERLKTVRKVLNNTIADYKKVIDIPSDTVNSSQEAIEIYKKYLSQGYEGAMLKTLDGNYRWKRVTIRSGEMLKLKPFKSADLEVKSIYDGEGKHTGVAGGVVVDFNGVPVRCGSGFDDATRKAMAEKPNEYIGKMAEIKYLEVTEDGSLRHPTFERWREEKD